MSTITPGVRTGQNFLAPSVNQVVHDDRTSHLQLGQVRPDADTFAITLTYKGQNPVEALALINRQYARRGYGANHKLSGRRHETTFTALCGKHLIGTVTLAADTGRGLDVDLTFPDEMQFFRLKQGARLCELKKLALDFETSAKVILGSLFYFVFTYGTINNLGTDLLIEVNPRHVLFYKKMLGFQRVGGVKTNISVNAPSQLMWLAVSDIERNIKNACLMDKDNTLYKYFRPASGC